MTSDPEHGPAPGCGEIDRLVVGGDELRRSGFATKAWAAPPSVIVGSAFGGGLAIPFNLILTMRRLKLGQFAIEVVLHASRLLVDNYHNLTINFDLNPGNHYTGSSDGADGSHDLGLGETGRWRGMSGCP